MAIEKPLLTEGGRVVKCFRSETQYYMKDGWDTYLWDESLINYIAESIKERVAKKLDTIVLVTGERGSGKSTLTILICQIISQVFDDKDITFTVEEFNEGLANDPTGDDEKGIYPIKMLDEAAWDLFAQNWGKKIQKNFVRKFTVIRAKREIVFFVLPHRDLLNSVLRETMGKYWIDVHMENLERGYAELWIGKTNKWKMSAYWNPFGGFTFPEAKGGMWDKYEVRKNAFIDKVLHEDGMGSENERETRAMTILHDKYNLTYEKIGDAWGITLQAVGKRVKQYSTKKV
jgi:energy-coupling factor transporter ATP-binding protein EcfA2